MEMKQSHKTRSALLAGLPASALLLVSAVCSAAPGELATAPLFLSNQTKPNLLLAIDDSVSMDYELSMPSNDGALWWNTMDQSFVGRNEYDALESGRINVNQAGSADSTWKEFVYLFPNGYNSNYNGKRMLPDGSNAYFGCLCLRTQPRLQQELLQPGVQLYTLAVLWKLQLLQCKPCGGTLRPGLYLCRQSRPDHGIQFR